MQQPCPVCGENDDAKFYWAVRKNKTGLTRRRKHFCKQCQSEKKKSEYQIAPEIILDRGRKWKSKNKAILAALQRKRRAAQLLRLPVWANLEKIKEFYLAARERGLEVDHILPLQGKTVSGLHVENNLQLLDKISNCKKGNRLHGT